MVLLHLAILLLTLEYTNIKLRNKDGIIMKKYYGFIYQGLGAIYNTEKELLFDNPYDALKNANDKWSDVNNYQIARLLVVLEQETINGETLPLKYAFFQFTDSKACEQFVLIQTVIKWSDCDDQVWNGNAHMM